MVKPAPDKYVPRMLPRISEAARNGLSVEQIASSIGVARNTLRQWIQKYADVRDAVEFGRLLRKDSTGLKEYIYGRLPEHLKRVWDRINALEDEPYSTQLVDRILSRHGKEVRQHLFLHALVHCHFSVTQAASKVGVARITVQRWALEDPDFAELISEIPNWKKDFAESCLFKLLQQGDPTVTIFVNRTLNRDRGYNEKVELDIKGEVNHSIDLDKLSVETKRQILEELRQRQNGNDIEGEKPRLLSTEENAA